MVQLCMPMVFVGTCRDSERTTVASQTTDSLFEQYRETRSPEILNEIVTEHINLVYRIARNVARKVPCHVSYDDLVSCGQFGLLDSIEKYDPARQTKFDTYAKARIHGAILDELRQWDWVPRTVRQRHRRIEEASERLQEMLGRPADDQEIAEYTELPVAVVRKTRVEHHEGLVTSLDEGPTDDDNGFSRSEHVADPGTAARPLVACHRDAVKKVLAENITSLSEKERLVVSLMYFENFAQRDIARILGVSDSRISQIHTAAINKLRRKLDRLREDLLAED